MPVLIILFSLLAMPAFAQSIDDNPLLQKALSGEAASPKASEEMTPVPPPSLSEQLPVDSLWQQVEATLLPVAESYTALAASDNKAALDNIKDGLATQKQAAADYLFDEVEQIFNPAEQAAIAQFLETPEGQKFARAYPKIWQKTYDKAVQDGFAVISAGGARANKQQNATPPPAAPQPLEAEEGASEEQTEEAPATEEQEAAE